MLREVCSVDVNEALRELTLHGTPDFECAAYELNFPAQAGQVIPWHWHSEMEAVYVAEGAVVVRIQGGSCRVRARDCYAINRNVLHSYEAEEGGRALSVVFSAEFVSGGANTVFEQRYMRPMMENRAFTGVLLRAEEHPGVIDSLQRSFTAMAEEPEGYEFTAREGLSRLCLCLAEMYADTVVRPARRNLDTERVQNMIAYIHEHFAENVTLADIAASAAVGERECERAFKRLIGVTPKQYVVKYRVSQAASMLFTRPDLSIGRVGLECGFNSGTVFSRTFRDYYNITPREYRRGLNGGEK